VFMNLGAFAVVVALAQEGRDCERMASFSGLASAHPGLAALMTLFMVSLVGIPGTAGFMGKWLVFKSAVNAGQVPLVIVAVLMTVVSVYYYLRIPVLMYMRDPEDERAQLDPTAAEYAVLAICAVAVVYLGLFADGSLGRYAPAVLEWSRGGIEQLIGS